jgi:hypothetical protein
VEAAELGNLKLGAESCADMNFETLKHRILRKRIVNILLSQTLEQNRYQGLLIGSALLDITPNQH